MHFDCARWQLQRAIASALLSGFLADLVQCNNKITDTDHDPGLAAASPTGGTRFRASSFICYTALPSPKTTRLRVPVVRVDTGVVGEGNQSSHERTHRKGQQIKARLEHSTPDSSSALR